MASKMPDPAHMGHSTTGSIALEERKNINSELWHACAGPLASLPDIGSYCVYLPQGHSEQVAASLQQDVVAQISNYHPNLPPQLVCHLHDVILHADLETDEVYCQMTLQPANMQERESCSVLDKSSQSKQPSVFFSKILTASDTSTHGGFSIPRRAAERVFPPLDFLKQPPAQEIFAKDLHDNDWTFRHIFRGQPKRHLLTTGWSIFVSTKRLMAGDSILFIRNDKNNLLLGIRRANRPQTFIPSALLSSDSMHIGVLAAAAHAASTNSRFTVFYNPRASLSEFVVPLPKFEKAVYHTRVSVGMRFRMLFETEESSVRRYMGTVTHIGDLDPVRWPNSPWRSIKVGWDELNASNRPRRVSFWEIEPLTNFLVYPPPSNWRLSSSWPLPNDVEFGGSRNPSIWAQFQHTSGLPYRSSAINPMLSSMQDVNNATAGPGLYGPSIDSASQECFTLNQLQLQQQHMQLDESQFKAQVQSQQPSLYTSCLQSHQQMLPFSQAPLQHSPIPQTGSQSGCLSLQQTCHSSFEQPHHQHTYQTMTESSSSQVVNTNILSMPHLSPMNTGANGGPVALHGSPFLLQSSTTPPSTLSSGTESTNESSLANTSKQPRLSPHSPGGSQVNSIGSTKFAAGIYQVDAVMQHNNSAPAMPSTIDTTDQHLLYSEAGINLLSQATAITTVESVEPGIVIEDFHNQYSSQFMKGQFPEESMELSSDAPLPHEQLHNDQYLQVSQAWGNANLPTRTYTKVYKSGSVGRSLDLTQFSDYNELLCKLEKFFGLEGQLEDPGLGWKLVFQDKEDDWLLLGDDPWEVFINNVRSLKILSPLEFMGFRNEVSMQQQQQKSYKSEDPSSLIASGASPEF